jgi:hypothetical protein
MKQKDFTMVAKVLFSLIAVAHLMRSVLGWPVEINDMSVPVWISYIAVVLFGYLAYSGYKLTK